MKTNTALLVILAGLFFVQSCKKDEDDSPTPKTITVNQPPASNYVYGTLVTTFSTGTAMKACWTTDGKEFFRFTDEFAGWSENAVNVCSDQLVLSYSPKSDQYVVAFAPLNDLKHFTKISSSRNLTDVAIINGVVVGSANEGNNFYRGYCDTKAGETEMTFDLLPASTVFFGYQLLGSMLICKVQTVGGNGLAYTSDGKNWTITNEPVINSSYYYKNGKITAYTSYLAASNTGTDLSTGWVIDTLSDALMNFSDTIGQFNPTYKSIIPRGTALYSYGSIYSFKSGKHYPCANISNDQGQTWNTLLLVGIPSYSNNTNWTGNIISSSSLLIIDNVPGDGTFPEGIYSSGNGIDFTLWTNASEIENFANFFNPKSVM